jgi:hypothetical protein
MQQHHPVPRDNIAVYLRVRELDRRGAVAQQVILHFSIDNYRVPKTNLKFIVLGIVTWSEMEWSGVEWSGVEWSGVE